MRKFVLTVLFCVTGLFPAAAESDPQYEKLYQALRMDEVLEIMRAEGTAYASELEQDMFPGRGGARWDGIVEQIYRAPRFKQVMHAAFAEALGDTDLTPLVAYFASDAGQEITKLEILARRALLDDATEAASRLKLEEMRAEEDDRLILLEDFAAANDLIENNVVGALNSNYAFFVGLVDSGAFPVAMTDDEILSEVWSQEPDIRDETDEWLYSYLVLAYEPLDDAAMRAYITLSQSAEGRALNQAAFAAFDVLFRQVSRELGLGAGQMMAGEDI